MQCDQEKVLKQIVNNTIYIYIYIYFVYAVAIATVSPCSVVGIVILA